MTKISVAHLIYSYLPVTQNWIYTQLRCNTACSHHIISMMEEHCEQFPWSKRETAFPRQGILNKLGILAARYWVKQPQQFLKASIEKIQPDCIHGHFSTESWRILKIAQKASLPLITTFYGLDVEKLPRRRFWKKKYAELFAYGDRFLVEGPFMGERLSAIGCPEDKITVVALGVDRELYHAPEPFDHPGDQRTLRILFVGLSRDKKGPLDAAKIFVAAAKQNKNLTLDVIGEGHYRAAFQKVISHGDLEDRVTFHGNVSFDQYRKILGRCSIVLVPSCYAADGDCEGGAPVVCIEAQVAGKVVVATKHCDIPYVVVDGKSGLLSDEHDIPSMVHSILELAGDKQLRERMGAQGVQHTQMQHDSYRQAEKLASVYRSVVKSHCPE